MSLFSCVVLKNGGVIMQFLLFHLQVHRCVFSLKWMLNLSASYFICCYILILKFSFVSFLYFQFLAETVYFLNKTFYIFICFRNLWLYDDTGFRINWQGCWNCQQNMFHHIIINFWNKWKWWNMFCWQL